jgi:hypothetical protein
MNETPETLAGHKVITEGLANILYPCDEDADDVPVIYILFYIW